MSSFRRWCDSCRRHGGHHGIRPILGVILILVGLLILILSAPSWLIGVIIALLCFLLGAWLF